ncbi:MAG: glycosyltransferase family 4 protein [Syntrophobacteraceae bacterium]|nr:glycosyltransferase family 4 protein [Desulfobacteraceae bacterium]
MKKILLVNTYHFRGGGDSTYTFNLAGLLRGKGHEVAFFGMKDARNVPDEHEEFFVEPIDFRKLNDRRSLRDCVSVLSRVIYSRENRRRFSKILDRFNPDIVHLQNIHGHISPSVIFEANARGVPVVWTLHDYKLICPNTHLLVDSTRQVCEACADARYYRAVLKCCKKGSRLASGMAALEAYAHRWMHVREGVGRFLTPSGFLREKLLRLAGFAAEEVVHLPLFIPPEMFTNGGRDEGYILFMAKLDSIKGLHVLLDACRLAPSVRVVLAGRLEVPHAEKFIAALPENATYVGMKHGEELNRLRSQARAVVLPSVWYENQPFTIIEAFAAGKAVIASDLGGMTELVLHGRRGLLVPPDDAHSLANAMQWVASNPPEAARMGQDARRYAAGEHAADVHYERLLEIYKGVSDGMRGHRDLPV